MNKQTSFPDVRAVNKPKSKRFNGSKPRLIADCTEKLNPDFDSTQRVATLFTGAFNLSTTSIHGSILTLPFVFAQCGVGTSTILILLFALTTLMTLDFLCRCARKLSADSLPAIVAELSNLKFQLMFNIFVFAIKFALIVGSFLLMSQIGIDIVVFFTGYHIRDEYILIIGVTLSFPMTLLKSMVELRLACYVSFCSILLVLLNMLVVVTLGLANSAKPLSIYRLQLWPHSVRDVLSCIPLIAILFIPNFGVMDVFKQLHSPTQQRTFNLIKATIFMMTFIYLSIGILGYLALVYLFDNVSEDNIINAFPSRGGDMIAARCLMFVVLVCNIPVMVVPARSFLSSLKGLFVEAFCKSIVTCEKGGAEGGARGGRSLRKQKEEGQSWESMSELTAHSQLFGQYGAMTPSYQYSTFESAEERRADTFITDRADFNDTYSSDDNDDDISSSTEGFADSVVGGDALDEPGAKFENRRQAFEEGKGSEEVKSEGSGRKGGDDTDHNKLLHQSNTVSPSTTWSKYLQMFTLNVVILSVTFLVATHVPDRVSLVWQVAGSLVVLPVTVCVPAVFYLLLGRKLHTTSDKLTYTAYVMVLISVPLVVVCGYYNVIKLI